MACALESLASSKYCLGGVTAAGARHRGTGSARRSRIGVPRSRGGRVRATAPGASAPVASATVQLAAAWPTGRTPAASTEQASGGGSEGLQLQAVRPPTPRPGAHVGAEEA